MLPTPKLHYGTVFQLSIPETWQECFYITLYRLEQKSAVVIEKVTENVLTNVPIPAVARAGKRTFVASFGQPSRRFLLYLV